MVSVNLRHSQQPCQLVYSIKRTALMTALANKATMSYSKSSGFLQISCSQNPQHAGCKKGFVCLQGSVSVGGPGPSGLYIPEPMLSDLARDSDTSSANVQHDHTAVHHMGQPQFTWQGKADMPPAWYQTNQQSPGNAGSEKMPQSCDSHKVPRDPFRLLPASVFEQQPDACMLTNGYNSQGALQRQQLQLVTNPVQTRPHSSHQRSENTTAYSSWQAQAQSVHGMHDAMQQRPSWEVPGMQGALKLVCICTDCPLTRTVLGCGPFHLYQALCVNTSRRLHVCKYLACAGIVTGLYVLNGAC